MHPYPTRKLICCAALVVTNCLLVCGSAKAVEFEGVMLPNSLTAGGKNLRLNGMGLRTRAVFKIYVGGLYLESNSKDPAKILLADAGKLVQIHFLRDLTRDQLVDDFQHAFERNARDKTGQRDAFDRMLTLVPDVWKGDTLTFLYLPGKGTTLQVGDRELGVFEGKGFASAVFAMWLGPYPTSRDLQTGMLGK